MLAGNHLMPAEIESRLPLVDFSSEDLALALHQPYSWKYGFVKGYILLEHHLSMLTIGMVLDFLDHGLLELCGIGLLHGLMHVHRIGI